MAIGVKERKASSLLPAISLSFITFRRRSHSKSNHNSRNYKFSLSSIKKSKSKLKSLPDPHNPNTSILPNPTSVPQPAQSINSNEPRTLLTQRAEPMDAKVLAMREAFDVIQSGPDGRVSPSDLGFLMRSIGANPTQSEINSILLKERLTSSFSFNTFRDVMARHLKPEQCEPRLEDVFKFFDPDNTGSVIVSELRNILTGVGERLQPSEFDEWIRELGVGSNDRVRYEEFFAPLN